ncbi:hypothetical protein SAMN02746093_02844 [Legionella quinlivanii DSM 21216]|uniref:hypothetical protein n=1 Tax=Legionella quinlivanii TaxID=45073 RepID=UPI00089E6330|nr:hypothetical protein [Legionella quinlivanii]SEG40939.1 hypothetical protein SAMN02746093_02844 [Legionella quinlivanii DSM 21216]
MSQFSTFSIYENEMRHFIDSLNQAAVDIAKITDWLYGAGVYAYTSAQGALYYPFEAECLQKFKHRPLISPYHSQGQHFEGLSALRVALISVFAKENDELAEMLENNFNTIVLAKIYNHREFIKIEAEVASTFNDFMDANGPLDPLSSLEKVTQLFEERKEKHPQLEYDFNNKLSLMREFLAEAKKKMAEQAKVTSIKGAGSITFLKPLKTNEEDGPPVSLTKLGYNTNCDV